jgi:hypothetical protein
VKTGSSGIALFSIPPGNYDCKIFSNGDLIASRNLEVLNEKKSKIVTNSEPLVPYIVIGFSIIALILFLFYYKQQNNRIFLLKILALCLAAVALVSPWWALHGSTGNPHLETSTNMFIVPTEMVTITSNNNLSAGELASLAEEFTSVIELIPLIIGLGLVLIIFTVILKQFSRRKLSFLVFFLSLLILLGSIIVFSYAMSELTKLTVGGFIGDGDLDIRIPGETIYKTMSCSWGPNIGYHLFIASIVSLLIAFCLTLKKMHFIEKTISSIKNILIR